MFIYWYSAVKWAIWPIKREVHSQNSQYKHNKMGSKWPVFLFFFSFLNNSFLLIFMQLN
jgi:hypothetical protein